MSKQFNNHVSEAIKLQSFSDKKEMDEAIKQHLSEHGANLSDTTIEVLSLLSRYACKYPGVSFLKHATIAQNIAKSRLTVIRHIKKLTDIGIVEKIPFTRSINGGKGANLYVIQPYDTSELIQRKESLEPTPVKVKTIKSISEPLFYSKQDQYMLDTAKAVKNAIPAVIYDVLSPFFNAKDIQRITGIIFRAKTNKVRLESHKEAYTSLFLDVIRRYKAGKLSNIDGYLFASVKRLSRRLFIHHQPT